MRQYDVVISTPNSASPAQKAVSNPPEDLFDLVLVDEAHHSPAPTWNALCEAFPKARVVLFTATPFRRDGKEIKGKYVYTYPIQKAFEDGIYGEMQYIPVTVASGLDPDKELARQTAYEFAKDKASGYQHIVMVRANTRTQAIKLQEIYGKETTLRLEVVHSGLSNRATERTVAQLRKGELDGVICVNMLGEGFDLPRLKIAALHSPHRSLSVTLQFLGRFARVNGEGLGDAKFLAIQEEINHDMESLFQESSAWGRRIRAIGQRQISKEIQTREFLEEFENNEAIGDEATLDDLSLYSFSLFNHAKVYQVHGEVDLWAKPALQGFTVKKSWVNRKHATAAFIAREESLPKWTSAGVLSTTEYHLFVCHYDEKAGLLFICATCREDVIFKQIAALFVKGHVLGLSLNKINRVLRSFTSLELFNVGMRNRATGTVAESYRQIAGSAAHVAIEKSDGTLYHRGHVFGRGTTPDGVTTIGLSSLSKVWRLEQSKLPQLIGWFTSMAGDIVNPAPFTTGIALDYLDAGVDVEVLPALTVLAADWQNGCYDKPPLLFVPGVTRPMSLIDTDISVNWLPEKPDRYEVTIRLEEGEVNLIYLLSPYPHFEYRDESQTKWEIERAAKRRYDIIEYLNENPLRFHLADGSILEGNQIFPVPADDTPFDAETLMEAIDWQGNNVDPYREFGECTAPLRSIHDWLSERLVNGSSEIVFYDHRPGECADYLTVDLNDDGSPLIRLYHCKGAGGKPSGERDNDLFDVCGQVTKSTRWRNRKVLVKQVNKRTQTGSVFRKGNLKMFAELVASSPQHQFALEVYIVQPGVSVQKLSTKSSNLMATISRGLLAHGCERLRVLCSA
ncbi:hypothetical protein GCM10027275_49750 [Rhabdobacter roseus]|uniref:Uncharacterized protein n=1 Tax=Rhabdobacter roseus TaxID=1655419 RepID=A0A840TZT0_9BACT|nr:DEAD/DEAH box helicase family protein [Rhabdobacter roseus]MBB5287037.1 hypothetical protein [Rhabdobacter roseus]